MIDWQRVQTLKEEVGSDDFDEIVPLFLAEVSETTNKLKSEPDLTVLHKDLHALRGSAMNLGFSAFSELCSTGESQASQGHAAAVDIAEIVASFDTSRQEFLNGLAGGRVP